MRTRKARLPDAARIHELIAHYASLQILLPRPLPEICENIRDFTVAENGGRVVGCGALHFYGTDLAEIRSLAVDASAQGNGAGRRVVHALLNESRTHSVSRICLFTHIPEYFARFGFVAVEAEQLPQKIWRDCLRCVHFDRCNETAMIYGGIPEHVAGHPSRLVTFRSLPG